MRLAHVTPPACSGCFQQKLTKRHVDFDVAYDGPSMMNPQGGHQPIDDLILCEDCLLEAGKLVSLVPATKFEKVNGQLYAAQAQASEQERRAETAESRLAAMETALELLRLNVQPAPPAQGGQRTKNQTAKPKAV